MAMLSHRISEPQKCDDAAGLAGDELTVGTGLLPCRQPDTAVQPRMRVPDG